jgi:GNAT superfamily N-acetyltransferase
MDFLWREASHSDAGLLAEWNHQLIRDEGHRNAMTVEELRSRMKKWLTGEYRAFIFSIDDPVAYILFKEDEGAIYLRQLFVRRDCRSTGIGSAAFSLLREHIWPGGSRLTVEVLCENRRAISFYRKMGHRDHCLTMEIT